MVLYGSESKNVDDVLQSEWCHRTQELEQLAKTVDHDFCWSTVRQSVLPSIVREVLGKSRKHIGGVVCMVFRSCSWCNG